MKCPKITPGALLRCCPMTAQVAGSSLVEWLSKCNQWEWSLGCYWTTYARECNENVESILLVSDVHPQHVQYLPKQKSSNYRPPNADSMDKSTPSSIEFHCEMPGSISVSGQPSRSLDHGSFHSCGCKKVSGTRSTFEVIGGLQLAGSVLLSCSSA